MPKCPQLQGATIDGRHCLNLRQSRLCWTSELLWGADIGLHNIQQMMLMCPACHQAKENYWLSVLHSLVNTGQLWWQGMVNFSAVLIWGHNHEFYSSLLLTSVRIQGHWPMIFNAKKNSANFGKPFVWRPQDKIISLCPKSQILCILFLVMHINDSECTNYRSIL